MQKAANKESNMDIHPLKTNMTLENQPFEDVSPIQNLNFQGGYIYVFVAYHVFFRGRKIHPSFFNACFFPESCLRHNPSQPLLLTAAVGVGKPTAEAAYDIPGMSQ